MLYRPAGVDEQPEVSLTEWKVLEVQDNPVTRHLAGHEYSARGPFDSDGGRVSSAIQSFDKEKRAVVTLSGRTYLLKGPSGHSITSAASYVWGAWCRGNKVEKFQDVTKEYE